MSNEAIRAWKDPEIREALAPAPHPAGEVDLSDLAGATEYGAIRTEFLRTLGCCKGFTNPWPICIFTAPGISCNQY